SILERDGHTVRAMSHAREALRVARQSRPDLIISDLLMPDMDGFEFVRQLRTVPEIRATRIIFFTANHGLESAEALAEACGVSHILPKPSPQKDILDAVRSILGSEPQPAVAPAAAFERQHARVLNDKIFEQVRELEETNEKLRLSEAQLHRLTARLQSAHEEERTRVARYLHDELGQMLTALRMTCALLSARMPRERADLAEYVESCEKLTDEMVVAVQRLATDLRPGVLDLGLPGALEWQLREFENRSGIRCAIELPGEEPALDSTCATELFRIFQETLTNVARHSGATLLDVSLDCQDGNVTLRVRDNGRGITREEQSSQRAIGLLGMRERASLIGGSLSIAGESGAGTTVSVTAPVRPLELSGNK
ncbi:MAG: response regulator, partial [Acidobacteriota bacterium]|nr:response regulator [Acidobacteriota bacterium]